MKIVVNLGELARALVDEFPSITSLWLFGSRRYGTRSVRSDIDVLVCATDHLRPGDLRQAIRRHCSALDLFIVEGSKAVSCMNESFVQAATFDELRQRLDAVCIWSADPSAITRDVSFDQEIRTDVVYKPTGLDGGTGWSRSVDDYFGEVAADGLPTRPFVGGTINEITTFLAELAGKIITAITALGARQSRASWKPKLASEYDFQDAFFLVAKPWFPGLAREEVTIRFVTHPPTACA
jgi:hypothetical protein